MSPAAAGRLATLDDLFHRVASNADGFAGAWYADDGALTVAVRPAGRSVTSAEKKRALDALVSVFGKDVLEPVPSMQRSQSGIGKVAFQRADYRFLELHAWYQDVRPALELRGVGYTDIDERTNRLVVGVAGGKPSADVVNYLSKVGVPFSAIRFQDSQELYYYYSGSIIGSEQRPALGGIELGLQQGGRCSLGINAFFPVWWWQEPGFITAGHCGSFGDWSADWYSQPDGGDVIAAEHFNPGFVGGDDCPTDGCRFSDAAAVKYDADVEFAGQASVIRTMSFEGDVNIDTSNETIDVTGESSWLLSGDNVYKIGVGIGGGGGWTVGAIGTTCSTSSRPSPYNEIASNRSASAAARRGVPATSRRRPVRRRRCVCRSPRVPVRPSGGRFRHRPLSHRSVAAAGRRAPGTSRRPAAGRRAARRPGYVRHVGDERAADGWPGLDYV